MYKKPTQTELKAAIIKTVPDIIQPDLKVLFCGINPGLYTAAIGHHFGRPGNRFWKALYDAGFTDRLFDPHEDVELLNLGYGITNFVSRTTVSAADIRGEEFIEGGKQLVKKVNHFKPHWLAAVGIQAYRVAFQQPHAKLGRQEETIGETSIWVLPNPSGLNAHFHSHDFARLFAGLKKVTG